MAKTIDRDAGWKALIAEKLGRANVSKWDLCFSMESNGVTKILSAETRPLGGKEMLVVTWLRAQSYLCLGAGAAIRKGRPERETVVFAPKGWARVYPPYTHKRNGGWSRIEAGCAYARALAREHGKDERRGCWRRPLEVVRENAPWEKWASDDARWVKRDRRGHPACEMSETKWSRPKEVKVA